VNQRRRLIEAVVCAAGPECVSTILDEHTLDAILEGLYASLAQWVVTPIQELFGWNNRVNVPGTISETNWNCRLPYLERSMEGPCLRKHVVRIRTFCEKTRRFTPNRQ